MLKSQRAYHKVAWVVLWRAPREIIIYLLMKDAGKAKFILKAVIDGLINRTGKTVSPTNK